MVSVIVCSIDSLFALPRQLFFVSLIDWKYTNVYNSVLCRLQHRLRNCGLSNVIYLVEEYGSMEHFKLPAETLNQAIINTQVLVVG